MSAHAKLLCLSASAALGIAASASAAAQEAATPQADGGTDIVVTGTRLQIREELALLLDSSGDQLARFEDPLCPLIIGFDSEYSGHLRELILANATRLGVAAGTADCTPNAFVIFIDQPQALVEAMRNKMHWVFGAMTLPARDRLTKPLRGSYSWHANYLTGADGRAAVDGADLVSPALEGLPTIRAFSASRLYSPAIQVMGSAFVVMDIAKTPGMTLGQIADFVTLNVLVDLGHDAPRRARGDSILRLFEASDPGEATPRMNAFDRALVSALYQPKTLAQSATSMRMRLATLMKREAAASEAEPAE